MIQLKSIHKNGEIIISVDTHTYTIRLEQDLQIRCTPFEDDNDVWYRDYKTLRIWLMLSKYCHAYNSVTIDCSGFYCLNDFTIHDGHFKIMQILTLGKNSEAYYVICGSYFIRIVSNKWLIENIDELDKIINVSEYFQFNYKQMAQNYGIFLLIIKYCYFSDKKYVIDELMQITNHKINANDSIFSGCDDNLLEYITILSQDKD